MSVEAGDSMTPSADAAFGRLGAQMEYILEQLRHLDAKVDEANERLIKLEAKDFGADLAALKIKVDRLEKTEVKQSTAYDTLKSLPQWLGWVAAALLGFGHFMDW